MTSALPKEGKSFTSANLAQVMVRQHGRRVLLIDADLRGPRLHLMLGTSASPGLSDYLQGRAMNSRSCNAVQWRTCSSSPAASTSPIPRNWLSNGRLKILLQRVEPLFDWIIIDSPPAVPVSDASVLVEGMRWRADGGALQCDARGHGAPRARQEFPEQALVGVVLNGIGP